MCEGRKKETHIELRWSKGRMQRMLVAGSASGRIEREHCLKAEAYAVDGKCLPQQDGAVQSMTSLLRCCCCVDGWKASAASRLLRQRRTQSGVRSGMESLVPGCFCFCRQVHEIFEARCCSVRLQETIRASLAGCGHKAPQPTQQEISLHRLIQAKAEYNITRATKALKRLNSLLLMLIFEAKNRPLGVPG